MNAGRLNRIFILGGIDDDDGDGGGVVDDGDWGVVEIYLC